MKPPAVRIVVASADRNLVGGWEGRRRWRIRTSSESLWYGGCWRRRLGCRRWLGRAVLPRRRCIVGEIKSKLIQVSRAGLSGAQRLAAVMESATLNEAELNFSSLRYLSLKGSPRTSASAVQSMGVLVQCQPPPNRGGRHHVKSVAGIDDSQPLILQRLNIDKKAWGIGVHSRSSPFGRALGLLDHAPNRLTSSRSSPLRDAPTVRLRAGWRSNPTASR
jgi:hypothetical protein